MSSALAGLPIQRPRVHNPHGTGGTPVVGPTSHAGADPSAAVLALPEIPAYATPVHPAHADAQLAFEALFSGELSPGDAAHVAARMWRYTVPAGQPLFAADEPAESAFVVATGLGRIEVSGPFGPMALIPLRSGDLVGLAALTGDATNGHAAVAASDLVVFALRRDEFHKLCAEAPHLAQRLLAAGLVQASRRIRALAERMTQYAQLDTADPAAPAVAPAESRGSRLGRFLARLKDPKENG
ncbi:MAG: cyclic nucleotide-binding domain-containing protein [Deltaproteobacteria bacterium]|nr:cyclic nucleotide-binding domain-containing protein [Deltaproteobacteria bacterium]